MSKYIFPERNTVNAGCGSIRAAIVQSSLNRIRREKLNKSDLVRREKLNDSFIHNPNYLYGHPDNNSKILYNDRLQELFLKYKNETNRYENVSHSGDGFHHI